MLLRAGLAIGLTMLASATGYAREWKTAEGAVICRDYFALGEALTSKNDPKWFAETGCRREAAGVPLTIIQRRDGLVETQVRLHSDTPETVWMSIFDVMGYAAVHGRHGPLQYHDVFRIERPEAFGAVLKELSTR